jgi:hypothetical protein
MASIETNMKFVKELLNSGAISQKERQIILGLVEKELIQENKELKSKLQEIGDSKKVIKEKEIFFDEFYHNPSKVVKLLSEFTNNNYPVKWLVHTIDSSNYESYDELIAPIEEKSYFNKWEKLKIYDKELWWDVIFPFIFQKEPTKFQKEGTDKYGWGRNEIKIGWQYLGIIKKWCENNMNNKSPEERRYPFEMKIPSEFKPNIRGVQTFEALVGEFNKEIRYERSSLKNEINSLGKEIFKQHNFENQIDQVGKFYVHTWKVKNAIKKIFQMIEWRTENKEVKIYKSFNEDNTVMFLNITHLNSFSPNRPDDVSMNALNGDLAGLVKNLKNVCDFSIESRFKCIDGSDNYHPYRINYLYEGVTSNESDGPTIKIESNVNIKINGFNYRLGFHLLKLDQK